MVDQSPTDRSSSMRPEKFYEGESAPGYTEESNRSGVIRDKRNDDFNKRFDLNKLLNGVQRHIVAIILSTLIFFILGSFATYNYLTTYRAEAVVVFQEDKGVALAGGGSLPILTLPTAMELIQLAVNFEAIKKNLGLNYSIAELQSMISVPTPLYNSNLIKIVARADNRFLAIDVANAVAKTAVKASQEYNQKQLHQALLSYSDQLEIVSQRLNSQLKEIEQFKEENKYLEMTAEHQQFITLITSSRTRLENAKVRYNALLVEYENLKEEVAKLPDQILVPQSYYREGQINPLQSRIVALETSLSEARVKYAKENPRLKALESELENLVEQLKEQPEEETKQIRFLTKNELKEKLQAELLQLDGKVRAAKKTQDDLALTYASLQKDLEVLPAKQIAFSKLLHSKLITEDEQKFLTNAVETTQLMINIPRGNLELYQLAKESKPWKDSIFVMLLPIIFSLFGLLAGIGIAMFFEMQDDKFCSAKQVELAYTVPCIGIIPKITNLTRNNAEDKLLFFTRVIVERLEKIFVKSNTESLITSIGVTSPLHDEGKSLIAESIALYYKRLGKKVLLVQADYRSLISSDITPKMTLEEFLKNPGSISDLIIRGKFDLIKTGSNKELMMKELIKSNAMKELWDNLNNQYEIIIFDIPGVIDEDYAINLLAMSQTVLFVINSPENPSKIVDESLMQLSLHDISPDGIVLTDVPPIFIEDQRTLNEIKRLKKGFWENLIFWKKD